MQEGLFGLTDRPILVSGAGGGGIGTATCTVLARVGAQVVGIDRDASALAQAAAAVEEVGGRLVCVEADVSDAEGAAAAIQRAEQAVGGPPQGLVNVVGGVELEGWMPLVDYPLDRFESVMDLNLRTALLTSQACARAMIAGGTTGAIVSLSSISADGGSPFHAPYGAAKAALRQLAQTMALEWGRNGIRVNVVAPGTIETPRATLPEDPERDRQAIPLGRRGRASEIASAALFLLSDLASYVTGQTLVVDGGATTKLAHLDADGLPIFMSQTELRERIRGG